MSANRAITNFENENDDELVTTANFAIKPQRSVLGCKINLPTNLSKIVLLVSIPYICSPQCGCGEIGRRTRLRI